TLVAGMFGLFPGDTSVVQCINATNLTQQQLASHVYNVYDSTAASCVPDMVTKPGGPILADFLAAPAGPFRGGTIVDVSHGNAIAIYGQTDVGQFFSNLDIEDVPRIPPDRLNVFISIACDNDAPGVRNLAAAMYERASVAVVSATTAVTPVNVDDILFAEVESVIALYRKRENLAQQFHAFRADYYTRFVVPATGAVRQALWVNVLTENLVGDGLVTVAP